MKTPLTTVIVAVVAPVVIFVVVVVAFVATTYPVYQIDRRIQESLCSDPTVVKSDCPNPGGYVRWIRHGSR